MSDIGPRDELYMVDPKGKLEKMDPNEHHLEYLMNFYPDEEDYNEEFWDTIFDGGWVRIELKENSRNGWDLAVNGKSLYKMKAIVRDNFIERLKRGENKVHIEEWTGTGMNPTKNFYLPMQKEEFYDFILEKLQAKFIYEALDFERRLNPKSSMDIGKTHLDRELIQKIPWDLNLLDQPENEIKVIDFIKDYRGFPILVYLDIHQRSAYTHDSSYQATSTMDHTGFCTSIKVSIGSMKRRIDNLLRQGIPKQLLNWKMTESQNFERGLEPKASMGIGKKAQLKKLDQETDWGFEISTAFDRVIWDIINYNNHLIKITKVSGSDGIGYYMALNDSGEPYNSTPPLYPTPEEALDWDQKYLDQLDMGL